MIQDLGFKGNANVTGVTGGGGLHLRADATTCDIHSVFDHVYVFNAKGDGILLEGTNNTQWYNVQSNSNGGVGILLKTRPGVSPITSPESHFIAVEASQNAGNGFEVDSGSGNSEVFGLTTVGNSGQAIVIGGTGASQTVNNWRLFNLEVEATGKTPYVDLIGSSETIYGIQCFYRLTTDTCVRFNGSNNSAIYGFNSNSVASQIDWTFTAGAFGNVVEGAVTGDQLLASHVSNAGNNNAVRIGGAVYQGPQSLMWSTTPTPKFRFGPVYLLTATSNIAAVIQGMADGPVTSTQSSGCVTFILFNNSGGALKTAPKFAAAAYKTAGSVVIANGQRMSVNFCFDWVSGLFIETSRSAAM